MREVTPQRGEIQCKNTEVKILLTPIKNCRVLKSKHSNKCSLTVSSVCSIISDTHCYSFQAYGLLVQTVPQSPGGQNVWLIQNKCAKESERWTGQSAEICPQAMLSYSGIFNTVAHGWYNIHYTPQYGRDGSVLKKLHSKLPFRLCNRMCVKYTFCSAVQIGNDLSNDIQMSD